MSRNDTTREFPIEKLFRDVRPTRIAGDENGILASPRGVLMGELYRDGGTRESGCARRARRVGPTARGPSRACVASGVLPAGA
ncbi:hypothetical protein [Burkholderia cenocepacia]|uniref:hypothetical protein n=1 Tax=Burkholderia cenocepacia TaxID=95486 RepID=UPI001F49EF2B|nr:hypothetical protein [Burkholderia cenocepacia]